MTSISYMLTLSTLPQPGLIHSISKAISNPSHINKAFDWLTSVPQNTGIPGTFVFILLLLPAMALVWMCMSAADTAPDQHMVRNIILNAVGYEYGLGMFSNIFSHS